MKGTIVSFRRSRHRLSGNHMIVKVAKVETKDKAAELVGKVAVWKSPAGKEIKGKVASSHGNKGAIRIIFETGMPGQSLASKIEIN